MENIEKSLWKDKKRSTLFGLALSFTHYELKESRLFITKGLFSTKYDEVRLYRITDVSLTRNLIQKIFGLGTIYCTSSDKTLGNFELKNIKDSEKVKEILSEQVEKERMSHRVYARENMLDMDDELIDD